MDQAMQARLRSFAAAVEASPHNLVSRRARGELLSRHVPESVALAQQLPQGARRVLDIGSGGGFPGLVIAIVRPELDVHLLEATGKKVRFLRETADALGLDVTVHHGRAEELAGSGLAASFDVVTARAVASMERLLPLTVPFLAEGGVLYAVKGERWASELDEARDELQRHRLTVLSTPEDQPVDTAEAAQPLIVMLGRST